MILLSENKQKIPKIIGTKEKMLVLSGFNFSKNEEESMTDMSSNIQIS